MQEIWRELSTSDDVQDVQRFADTFSGVAESLEARRRIAYLLARREDYKLIWKQVESICFAPQGWSRRGEDEMRAAAADAKRVAANVRSFSDQWGANPWSEELSWVSGRLERSADINLHRSQVWEKARAELLSDFDAPPWQGWCDRFWMWDWWHKLLYVLIVASTILVAIPWAAIALGSILNSFFPGILSAALLYVALWFVLVYLWSAEDHYEEWQRRRREVQMGNEALWECESVKNDIIESFARFNSEHGESFSDVLWPDEHFLLYKYPGTLQRPVSLHLRLAMQLLRERSQRASESIDLSSLRIDRS